MDKIIKIIDLRDVTSVLFPATVALMNKNQFVRGLAWAVFGSAVTVLAIKVADEL